MQNVQMLKWIWFSSGMLIGLTILSISRAAIPKNVVTQDTALYQRLSEIRVTKQLPPSWDADLSRLERLEHRYRERLPLSAAPVRGQAPVQALANRLDAPLTHLTQIERSAQVRRPVAKRVQLRSVQPI